MLKEKRGNASFAILIFILLAIIGVSVFLYIYFTFDEEIQVPGPENIITVEDEVQTGQTVIKPNENVQNPLSGLQQQPISNQSIQNAYYYQQIDSNAKKIYDGLLNHKEELKTGTYTIDFGNQFDSILKEENGTEKMNRIYQIALDALTLDHPELFYIDVSKMIMTIHTRKVVLKTSYKVEIGNDSNANYLIDGFVNKEQVNQALQQIEQVKQTILDRRSANQYEQIKLAHDWIVDNVSYDESIRRTHTRNIYGTFVEKQVVCEGYAKAFQLLMNEMGIPCVIVVGTATNSEGKTESHAWNYVQLDETWYAIDTTWDDPIIRGGKVTNKLKYTYFLKGSASFNQNHVATGKASEQGMVFSYPELNRQDY